jgi:hypothetical protein
MIKTITSSLSNFQYIAGRALLQMFGIFLLFICSPLFSQEVNVSLDPEKILIGEQAKIRFEMNVPDGQLLIIPVFNETVNEKIEIINYGLNDTIRNGTSNTLTINRTLTVTSWEEGFHAIAPFVFYGVSGSDTIIVETEPLLLEVEPFSIEEQTDLKDIKSIFSAPVTLAELKYYILGILLLGLLIWLLIRYLKTRKKVPVVDSIWEKPDIPAHVAAISSLEELKAQQLWQNGKVKEYYSRLTDIIRHYMEKRFHINALEMTTSEIMEAVKQIQEIKPVRNTLESILVLADLVKFAKQVPSSTENEMSLDGAFELVKRTREETIDTKEIEEKDDQEKNRLE